MSTTKPITETGWRVVLPNTRAYDAAGTGNHSLFSGEHCCICGRPAKGDNWLLLARATDGTQEFAISNTVGLSDEERRSVWIAPIGPDCLKRHPELRFALIATTSDFEQLIRLREKAMRFVLDPDNQDCYHDSFHSTSADWPPEFLQLCDVVVEHCAHTYEHKDRDPTEDPNGYCTVSGCEQPLEHWIHLGTSERDEFLKDREALAHTGEQS